MRNSSPSSEGIFFVNILCAFRITRVHYRKFRLNYFLNQRQGKMKEYVYCRNHLPRSIPLRLTNVPNSVGIVPVSKFPPSMKRGNLNSKKLAIIACKE